MEAQKSPTQRYNEESIEFCPVQSNIHRRLTAILLQNPFWNDFHLLHCLRKLNPEMSLDDLRQLKIECNLASREDVCNILLRKLFSDCGSSLNTRQLDFIKKVYPELRDKDLQTEAPGKLVLYNCFGGQKIRLHGKVYIHIFVDLFNGYVFGRLSRQSSISAGVRVLKRHVAPLYETSGHKILTIVHSRRTAYDESGVVELASDGIVAQLGITWQQSDRGFGHIERFQTTVRASDFYTRSNLANNKFHELQSSFGQWLKKYNHGVNLN
jgi:hypothetical protein